MSDLTQPITNPELAQAVADMAAQGSPGEPGGSAGHRHLQGPFFGPR